MTGPYRTLLKLDKSWRLWATDWDFPRGRVVFEVKWDESTLPRCSQCGKECPADGRAPRRSWRILNVTRVEAIVRVNPLRWRCPEHGSQVMNVPWSEPATGYTEDRIANRGYARRLAGSLRAMLNTQPVERRYLAWMRVWRWVADKIRAPLINAAVAKVEVRTSSGVMLPFDVDPPYKSFPSLGTYPLGIMGAVADLRALLASEYINLACWRAPSARGSLSAGIVPYRPIGRFVLSGHCELLNANAELPLRVTGTRTLVQWLVDKLHDNWYVFSHINQYYLPGHASHLKRESPHDSLILGCDTRHRTFAVAGYLNGEFGVSHVPFGSVAMALTLLGSKYFRGPIEPLVLAVRPKGVAQFDFQRKLAYVNLGGYLRCTPPAVEIYASRDLTYVGDVAMAHGCPAASFHYGLDAFGRLIDHFQRCAREGNRKIDMRDTRVLWEHKRIMHSNIKYWQAHAGTSGLDRAARDYREVVSWVHSLHILCLAFNLNDPRMKGRDELLEHLNRSHNIVEIERAILTPMLALLADPDCGSAVRSRLAR